MTIAVAPPSLPGLHISSSVETMIQPNAKWTAANPGRPPQECPLDEMDVVFVLAGKETRPSALAPPERWPWAQFILGELARVPWPAWRQQIDTLFANANRVQVSPVPPT